MIGIYLMGFVILVSGVGALGTAVSYAIRPTDAKLALMRPLSMAGVFAALCSCVAGVATVLKGIAATGEVVLGQKGNIGNILMGFQETLIPLFVSFGFLAVAWLLVAVGIRRQA